MHLVYNGSLDRYEVVEIMGREMILIRVWFSVTYTISDGGQHLEGSQ